MRNPDMKNTDAANMHNNIANDVTELYDALTHTESFFGWRRPKATVHKTLDFSRSPTLSAYAGKDINHLIQVLPLGLHADSRILDAGCGHGGTLAHLIKACHCKGVGISLSPSQITTASALFPDARADFRTGSYDKPPAGPFDLIITVESLIHSANLQQSVQALASCLSERGHLLMVEDMAITPQGHAESDPHFSADSLRQYWHLAKFYSEADYLNAAQAAGLRICSEPGLQVQDLSACVVYRDTRKLRRTAGIIRLLTALLPASRFKTALKAAVGGYILEYFYAQGLAHYKLMVFERLCKD